MAWWGFWWGGGKGWRIYLANVPFGMIQSDDVVFHLVDPPEIPD